MLRKSSVYAGVVGSRFYQGSASEDGFGKGDFEIVHGGGVDQGVEGWEVDNFIGKLERAYIT